MARVIKLTKIMYDDENDRVHESGPEFVNVDQIVSFHALYRIRPGGTESTPYATLLCLAGRTIKVAELPEAVAELVNGERAISYRGADHG